MQRDPRFARPHEIRDTRVGDLLRAGGAGTRHKSCQYQWNPKTFFQCDSPSTEVDFELLTFALSGAPPQMGAKRTPLFFGASALERVVRLQRFAIHQQGVQNVR